jgi:hypothetical protein
VIYHGCLCNQDSALLIALTIRNLTKQGYFHQEVAIERQGYKLLFCIARDFTMSGFKSAAFLSAVLSTFICLHSAPLCSNIPLSVVQVTIDLLVSFFVHQEQESFRLDQGRRLVRWNQNLLVRTDAIQSIVQVGSGCPFISVDDTEAVSEVLACMSGIESYRQLMLKGNVVQIIENMLRYSSIKTRERFAVCLSNLAQSTAVNAILRPLRDGASELLQALIGSTSDNEVYSHCNVDKIAPRTLVTPYTSPIHHQ